MSRAESPLNFGIYSRAFPVLIEPLEILYLFVFTLVVVPKPVPLSGDML